MKKNRQDFPKNDPHLGGHGFKTHLDQGILFFFKDHYSCRSLLDIGCGPGDMVKLARSIGYDADGIDGDYSLKRNIDVILHDFIKGPYIHNKNYDLGYSCEFVEHVEEKYIPNFMESFKSCKQVVISFAPPGTKGYHHVNCNTQEYWIDVFKKNNFAFDAVITSQIRENSTMQRNFIRQQGLYFKNEN